MELLFSRLYTKDPAAPSLTTPDGLFVRVPDTLELAGGEVVSWYFTNKAHELKRKHSDKLGDLHALKRAFARSPHAGSEDDLVAKVGISCTYSQWGPAGLSVRCGVWGLHLCVVAQLYV
jgi:hypothetical protein